MLFKGVENPGQWPNAIARVSSSLSGWASIVGEGNSDADIDKLSDERLFRVLEWGGMEVKR